MESKLYKIDELNQAKYNPRKDLQPGDDEFESLKRSISQFGYVSPIIVNKRNHVIVGGHQRLKVLKSLGYEEVLCVLVDLNETDEKMLNIALNKIEGEWNMDQLELVLKDIKESGLDPTLTGFSMDDIDDLIGDFNPLAEDEINEFDEPNEDKETMVTCPKCRYTAEKEVFTI